MQVDFLFHRFGMFAAKYKIEHNPESVYCTEFDTHARAGKMTCQSIISVWTNLCVNGV